MTFVKQTRETPRWSRIIFGPVLQSYSKGREENQKVATHFVRINGVTTFLILYNACIAQETLRLHWQPRMPNRQLKLAHTQTAKFPLPPHLGTIMCTSRHGAYSVPPAWLLPNPVAQWIYRNSLQYNAHFWCSNSRQNSRVHTAPTKVQRKASTWKMSKNCFEKNSGGIHKCTRNMVFGNKVSLTWLISQNGVNTLLWYILPQMLTLLLSY